MRWFRFAVLILFAAVLQAGLLRNLNIKPDLLLILLVFFAVYCNSSEAIITSFTIGFAADIIGPAMGPHTLSFGFIGSLLAYMHRVVNARKMPYQALVIFVVGFLTGGLTCLLSFLKDRTFTPNIGSVLFWTSLYSGVVGPFLFLPFAWWMRIRTHRFGR